MDNIKVIKTCSDLLVKPFEGYHRRLPDGGCRAYPDPGTGGKPWTIGYGSTGASIGPDTTWTLEQAENALEEHLEGFLKALLVMSPVLMKPKNFWRLVAILSFVYNCGLGNYRISTLKKRVDAEDWQGASEQILKWNKTAGRVLAGLTRRRKAESLLLLKE